MRGGMEKATVGAQRSAQSDQRGRQTIADQSNQIGAGTSDAVRTIANER